MSAELYNRLHTICTGPLESWNAIHILNTAACCEGRIKFGLRGVMWIHERRTFFVVCLCRISLNKKSILSLSKPGTCTWPPMQLDGLQFGQWYRCVMLAAANQFLASSTEEEQAADPQLYIFKTCSVQPQWTQTQVTSLEVIYQPQKTFYNYWYIWNGKKMFWQIKYLPMNTKMILTLLLHKKIKYYY